MQNRISDLKASIALQNALKYSELLTVDDTAVMFHDLSFLEEKFNDLKSLFPKDTLHSVAIKANPLIALLDYLKTLGAGAEAATLPELYFAEKCGYDPQKMVFDSPAKTRQELEYALELGAHVNADSFQELERIDEFLKDNKSNSTIGIRINPQVGSGKIGITSVAGKYSKFGIPLNDMYDELLNIYLKYGWLTGVHLHVGSQGCEMELLLNGVERVLEFAETVNAKLEQTGSDRRIDIFDLGGGLPVSYFRDVAPDSMKDYRDALQSRFPQLFIGTYRLFTEFGRYMHANCGWTASRVEYVKDLAGVKTAMIHVGADLLMRACYLPQDWHHEIAVTDAQGNLKSLDKTDQYTIAGPLCFAGDIIARDVELPELEEGDHLIIHDTGAYTMGMWSRHNSRQLPKVVGYFNDGESFKILKERESLDRVYEFWK